MVVTASSSTSRGRIPAPKAGSWSKRSGSVSRAGLPDPSAGTDHSMVGRPARSGSLATNQMVAPSGENAGRPTVRSVAVTRTASPPPAGATKTSLTASSSRVSWRAETKATLAPSGLQAGSPWS